MIWTFPGGASGKESSCQCRRPKKPGFHPRVRKIPWTRKWQSTPVFLPGKFCGQRSLMGYRSWGRKEQLSITHIRWCIFLPSPRSITSGLRSCAPKVWRNLQFFKGFGRLNTLSLYSVTLALLCEGLLCRDWNVFSIVGWLHPPRMKKEKTLNTAVCQGLRSKSCRTSDTWAKIMGSVLHKVVECCNNDPRIVRDSLCPHPRAVFFHTGSDLCAPCYLQWDSSKHDTIINLKSAGELVFFFFSSFLYCWENTARL